MCYTIKGRDDPEEPADWSPEALEQWIATKRAKAHAFVDRGYSVEWLPDGENWFEVFIPERHRTHQAELRATAKIYPNPSEFGINGGRISKLQIDYRNAVDPIAQMFGHVTQIALVLYHYDRGEDVNRLKPGSEGERLYRDVLELLS